MSSSGTKPKTPRGQIRIARIITRLNIGGSAVHVIELASRLDPQQYDQRLLTGIASAGEGSLLELAEARGIETSVIPDLVNSFVPSPRDATAVVRIARFLRTFRPHIVETHTTKAGMIGRVAAKIARVPVILHVHHGYVRHHYGPLTTRTIVVIERALARLSTRLLTVGELIKREIVEFGVATADKVTVVPLGFDLNPLIGAESVRGELRHELRISPDVPLVGIVGRIVPVKRLPLFLDAALRISRETPARFVVAGDGTHRREAEAHAQAIGVADRVHFLGWRRDLPRVFADLDVAVVCSNAEGTPVSAIEAMAAACPVVATRVGGIPEVVSEGVSGLLCPPSDPDRLAQAIVKLIEDRDMARRMGVAGREIAVARYSIERLAADMDRLYRELLGM